MILLCADGLSEEERSAWHNRVIEITKNVDYWNADAKASINNLEYIEENKHTMTNERYLAEKAEAEEARDGSERNLRNEQRQLDIVQRKGPNSNSSTAASTAGTVRNISEASGSIEQGPSKKR